MARKERSLLIPFLISLFAVGMVVFFFVKEEKPERPLDKKPESHLDKKPKQELVQLGEELPALDPEPAPQRKSGKSAPAVRAPLAAFVESPPFQGEFSSWMTIPDLDVTNSLISENQRKSVWERGYWVVAAEGRWHLDTPQFRLGWEKIPEEGRFHWQYRINESEEEFSESIETFLNKGFYLVYSHSFKLPDRSKRYQGVWQKLLINRSHSAVTIPIGRRPVKATADAAGEKILPADRRPKSPSHLRDSKRRTDNTTTPVTEPPTGNSEVDLDNVLQFRERD